MPAFLKGFVRLLFLGAVLSGFPGTGGAVFGHEKSCFEPELGARAWLLGDVKTGRILKEINGNTRIAPASMTKVMTLFLCYDALAEGYVAFDKVLTIDEAGSSFSRPPFSSLMLLEEGQNVTFLDLMKGLAVASGNDAAHALADFLGPGVDAFVEKMNHRAAELGLEDTVFVDPDGWSGKNQTSPRDFFTLARAYILSHPQALEELHSIPFLVYPLPENMPENRTFRIQVPRKKRNTNLLLGRVEGVDGLKTGYVDEAGFNFTVTAQRQDVRLLAVLMGIQADSYYQGIQKRAKEAEQLLEYGFSHYENLPLPQPEMQSLRIWYSREENIVPKAAFLPKALLARSEAEQVQSVVELKAGLEAPLGARSPVGRIRWYLGDVLLAESVLICPEKVEKGTFWQRIRDGFIIWKQAHFS